MKCNFSIIHAPFGLIHTLARFSPSSAAFNFYRFLKFALYFLVTFGFQDSQTKNSHGAYISKLVNFNVLREEKDFKKCSYALT